MSVQAMHFEKPFPGQIARIIRLVAFDFDGVFTDNMVYVFENGSEAVRCFRSDGIGLRKLERVGIIPVIISTETNQVVAKRSQKLNIRCEPSMVARISVLHLM